MDFTFKIQERLVKSNFVFGGMNCIVSRFFNKTDLFFFVHYMNKWYYPAFLFFVTHTHTAFKVHSKYLLIYVHEYIHDSIM